MNKIDIDDLIINVAYDLTKGIIIHTLLCTIDNEEDFLCEKFIKRALYMIIAITVYHIIIKKLIINTHKK